MFWQELLGSYLGVILITLLGLLVGSFLNVVIYRLPIMMDRAEKSYAQAVISQVDFSEIVETTPHFNLLYPPSACPNCGHKIRAWQNIPVLSYLLQRGRCVGCGSSISLRYPLIEMLTAGLSFLVALQFHEVGALLCALLFTWGLITLFFIDAEHQLLPDAITLPLMWIGIFAGLFEWFIPLKMAVLGAMLGYLSLWSVYWIFKLITGREGMGYGDFKLLAALCAFQGPQAIPFILMVAAVCGLIYASFLRIARGKPIAFGPFLAAAGWITFMYGDEIGVLLGITGLY